MTEYGDEQRMCGGILGVEAARGGASGIRYGTNGSALLCAVRSMIWGVLAALADAVLLPVSIGERALSDKDAAEGVVDIDLCRISN